MHLDQTSCSVYACVLDFKLPLGKVIKAVKHILRYLVHTPKLGLWYPKDAMFDLTGYTDAVWAGDKVDCKSTSGACQFLGRS